MPRRTPRRGGSGRSRSRRPHRCAGDGRQPPRFGEEEDAVNQVLGAAERAGTCVLRPPVRQQPSTSSTTRDAEAWLRIRRPARTIWCLMTPATRASTRRGTCAARRFVSALLRMRSVTPFGRGSCTRSEATTAATALARRRSALMTCVSCPAVCPESRLGCRSCGAGSVSTPRPAVAAGVRRDERDQQGSTACIRARAPSRRGPTRTW